MVSFAQFRPEKDHQLQLKIWKAALPKLPKDAEFLLIGATRGEDDEKLLADLKQMAKDMQIAGSVRFLVNETR